MEKSSAVKLARVLNGLVMVTFICNLIILPLVPGLVGIGTEGGLGAFAGLEPYANPAVLPVRIGVAFLAVCWQFLFRVWREPYTAVLSFFLISCGICTAVILWQARGVLKSVVKENTFTMPNAKRLQRAAICCFVVSMAALVRLAWGGLYFYRSIAVFFTYNALFIPVFAMGGLLCLVMSALFRQAAELKAENDLTI